MISSRLWHVGLFGILFLLVLANFGFAATAVNTCGSDDDPSNDPLVKGEIEVKYGSGYWDSTKIGQLVMYEDKCSGSTVVDFYCDSTVYAGYNNKTTQCGAGLSCKSGVCAEVTCSDSDGGKNVNAKGETKLSNSTKSAVDVCAWNGKVRENYCEGYKNLTIDLDCPSGTSCKDGACVAGTNSCSDSDGGTDLTIKGTVTATGADGKVNKSTDFCSGTANILEMSCNTNNMNKTSWESCPLGSSCKDGACVADEDDGPSTPTVKCTVSNSPATTSKKNKVTCTNGTVVEDFCIDNSTLSDYKVKKDLISQSTIKCGAGKICSNGLCKKKPVSDEGADLSCTDSDGGIATAVKGSISYKELYATEPTVEYDSCKDTLNVYEKYCSNKKPKTKKVKCPAYMVCTDGACVDEDTAGSASSDNAGQLKKKSPLREFLMAALFNDYAYLYAPSTDAKSRMAKSWKIGSGNLLSEIFLYDFEPVEIGNPPE